MPGGIVLGAGVLGACVGAAAVYGYMQKRPEAPLATPMHSPPSQSGPGRLHPTYKYGIPIKERIREFSGHTVCFDPSTRNPAWVLERISKDDKPGDGKRAENFAEDKIIPARFRSKLQDYYKSGYDRGHMAAALNHKGSQQEMDDTFFLTNISPQVGDGFNRDYWARFERWAKNASRKADELFIATGPVFAPKFTENGLRSDHGFIGTPPNAVAVPTHYFKVLLAEFSDDKGAKQIAVGAFAMPNRPIAPETPLASFAVPLELLESLTGIEFFPRALSDSQRRAIDTAAADWRRLGMARQQALASEGHRQYLENLPGESKRDLVPASKLPSVAELSKVGTFSGPPAYRPRKTSGGGNAVHLCEKFWCDMKPDKYAR